MPRLVPEATDQQLSRYHSKIGKTGGKMRWQGFSDAKRKELMRQVRTSKAAHPKANDAFHLAQSVFLTENRLNKRHDASGSYENANDRLLRANERSRS